MKSPATGALWGLTALSLLSERAKFWPTFGVRATGISFATKQPFAARTCVVSAWLDKRGHESNLVRVMGRLGGIKTVPQPEPLPKETLEQEDKTL